MNTPSTRKRRIAAPIVLVIAIGALLARVPFAIAERASHYANMKPITDVYGFIQNHYYQDIDYEALQNGMINGLIEALDDPYTEFIPTEAIGDFDKYVRGNFVGIGASVNTQDNWLHIVSPLDDSPAYHAGVEADDLIITVDGLSTFQLNTNEIISRLSGEPGSVVTVTIEREGTAEDRPRAAIKPSVPAESHIIHTYDIDENIITKTFADRDEARKWLDTFLEAGKLHEEADEPEILAAPAPEPGHIRFDLPIKRQRIITSTVKGIHREGDQWIFMIDPARKIGYVRVSQFTQGTVPELTRACKQLIEDGLKGLILDLRFNGGGSLDAAIKMSDLFLDDGLIVSQKGRTTSEEHAYARNSGTLPDFPMVVVVNGASASASEIVSGALADNDRAIILGERSFGKGLVQSLYSLPNGIGQLKITEQNYYLPSGRSIQRHDDSAQWGVDPTPGFYVPMTDDNTRDMLRRRREEEVIRNELPEVCCWDDPEWILTELIDPQLSAAVLAIRNQIETGDWIPSGNEQPEGAIERAALRVEQQRLERLLRELERSQRRIDTLASATGDPADQDVTDLFPDDTELTDGSLTISDADGNEITTLRITGETLERWLMDAPVEPITDEDDDADNESDTASTSTDPTSTDSADTE